MNIEELNSTFVYFLIIVAFSSIFLIDAASYFISHRVLSFGSKGYRNKRKKMKEGADCSRWQCGKWFLLEFILFFPFYSTNVDGFYVTSYVISYQNEEKQKNEEKKNELYGLAIRQVRRMWVALEFSSHFLFTHRFCFIFY